MSNKRRMTRRKRKRSRSSVADPVHFGQAPVSEAT